MREDEVPVEVNGLLVVLGRFGELAQDEVELRAMVEDVGIIFLLAQCKFEVL